MRFSQFCDTIENTEQEQKLFQFLKQDFVAPPLKEHSAKLKRIPILGKLLTAFIALADSESIAEFRQSKHYKHIMNWDVKFDFDAENYLSLNPSDLQKKKIVKILAIVGAILAVMIICLKCCRRNHGR